MATLVLSRRAELEAEIDDAIIEGRTNLRRICAALAEIQERKLFAPEFPTFEAYAESVWRMPATRARELAAAHTMAQTAATQTRAEDMPLFFHGYFANVIEDVGRPLGGLDIFERGGAREVARQIGTTTGRILQDVIEEHAASPEELADLPVEEQAEKRRNVSAAAAKRFGEKQAAEFVERLGKKLGRLMEELTDDPAITKYLPDGVESGMRELLALCEGE